MLRRLGCGLVGLFAGCVGPDASPDDGEMDKYLRLALAVPRPNYPSRLELKEPGGLGAVTYLGFDLEPPGALRPGVSIRVTHYLRVERPFSTSGQLWVRLEDSEKGPVFTGSHTPVEGRVPMSKWQSGQVWADTHRIEVPSGTVADLEMSVALVSSSSVPSGSARVGRLRVGK